MNAVDVVRGIESTKRVRVTRTIVFEGPQPWIVATLDKAITRVRNVACEFITTGRIVCTEESVEEIET